MAWPTTQVATGDLITAAQLNSLPIALAEASGVASSYDFTSIPSYWTHLLIVAMLQTGSGSNSDTLQIVFNNDTTSTLYIWQRLRATDTTVDSGGNSGQNYINGGEVPGKSAFSHHTIWIPNYAASKKHSVDVTGYAAWGSGTATQYVFHAGGSWQPSPSAAISRVTLSVAGASFVDGSIATLYGMGAI